MRKLEFPNLGNWFFRGLTSNAEEYAEESCSVLDSCSQIGQSIGSIFVEICSTSPPKQMADENILIHQKSMLYLFYLMLNCIMKVFLAKYL